MVGMKQKSREWAARTRLSENAQKRRRKKTIVMIIFQNNQDRTEKSDQERERERE